ncbi:acyltransferase [Dactylosporangium sp. AC04546]|uniref:acyltransferase family protein n=1 Tax=Dactylosporangium sp. AC04546 TaxID=2862460 RepID=UPI001EDE3911|nr:acyltransferase [Dactylosporangium sp. AC04546]WVK79314.1 acyltransferase [Dactylosporangium sp. AC04546]
MPASAAGRYRLAHGTLAGQWNGRDNGIGAIRLGLAVAVVVAHATSLGYGWEDLGQSLFRDQTNIGTLAVFGFFVISGLLITRSARRTSVGRFAWHRALRILPGLWVCLLVTAFVAAPAVALRERGTLDGFWDGPKGPVQYVVGNWFTGVRQYGIQDLLAGSPWGRAIGGSSVFDGALWSLVYESACYAAVAALAATAVLRRARWVVPATAAVLYAFILADQARGWTLTGPPAEHYAAIVAPLVGSVSVQWLIYLGALFLTGATIEMYRERVPIHDGLALACLATLAATLLLGGFFVAGFPALAYLLVWAAVRAPRRLRRVGAVNDYSYGIYIYGFVVQQLLSAFGLNRWGYAAYTALSLLFTAAVAAASWHLVERRALALKHWRVRRQSCSGAPVR